MNLLAKELADGLFSFTPHQQATVFQQETITTNHYIVALGKYKKRNNRWMPSKSLRARGRLERYTLEFPRDFQPHDVFSFYRQQLPADAKVLFECSGRQCGESNSWANEYFGIKHLYGTNASQHLVVYQLYEQQYITLYSVRRGNRRVYMQLEVLTQ